MEFTTASCFNDPHSQSTYIKNGFKFFFFFTCSWSLSWSTLLITCTQIVYCQTVELRYVYKCTVCGRDIILTFLVKPIEAFHSIFLQVYCHYKYCKMFPSLIANLLLFSLPIVKNHLFDLLLISWFQTSGITVGILQIQIQEICSQISWRRKKNLHLYFVTKLALMCVTPASRPTADVLLG